MIKIQTFHPLEGHVESGSFRTLRDAVQEIPELLQLQGYSDDLYYIGVVGKGREYAVLMLDKRYLNILQPQMFPSVIAYEQYVEDCKSSFESKTVKIGVFPKWKPYHTFEDKYGNTFSFMEYATFAEFWFSKSQKYLRQTFPTFAELQKCASSSKEARTKQL